MSAAEVLACVPGSVKFTYQARERRTASYRTWAGKHPDMSWCAECLLCGEWGSGYTARAGAEFWVDRVHGFYCHVTRGCHCAEPHITAVMAARLGIRGSYPLSCARELFRMAGGTRRYLQPHVDRAGNEFGPLVRELGDVHVCLGHGAGFPGGLVVSKCLHWVNRAEGQAS
jgi:hypothetical protein